MKLTTEQTRILNLHRGQHLVLAPPGTGKTELLTQRITTAIANGVDPRKMACLTFTNRAALNMLDRVGNGNRDVFIGNIHSFCNTYLRKNRIIPKTTSLLDEGDAKLLMEDAISLGEEFCLDKLEKQEKQAIKRLMEGLESREKLVQMEYDESVVREEKLQEVRKRGMSGSFLEQLEIFGGLERLIRSVGRVGLPVSFSRLDGVDRLGRLKRLGSLERLRELEAKESQERLEELREMLGWEYSIPLSSSEQLTFNSNVKKRILNFDLDLFNTTESKGMPCGTFERMVKCCEIYEELKKQFNCIDFDDLLTLTYHHLRETSPPPMFDWLQVDEVQDLNPLQWAIIDKITSIQKNHRVFFGDYEQSIFSFMGANLKVLDDVCSKSKMHELQSNFRSPQYLLDVYNKYASENLDPNWQGAPHSLKNEPKEVNSLGFKSVPGSESDEIEWIVKWKLSKEPKNITAILVRTNKFADGFAAAFDRAETKYFKISGFDLFQRALVKDIMAFLTVIINDDDRISWSRILKVYGRVETLVEARRILSAMFDCGMKPIDFVGGGEAATYLDAFLARMEHSRIIVFDTETTGLDTKNDDIIQIAALEIVNGKPGSTFEVFIDTDKDLTGSEKIHKISKKHLEAYGLNRGEALQSFLDFVGDSAILAHNLDYDVNILNANLRRCGLDVLPNNIAAYDSIEIAKRLYPRLPIYKLEYLLDYLNIEGENSHNALDDVKATANLILSFIEPIKAKANSRKDFINEHYVMLSDLNQNLSPLHSALSSKLYENMPIADVIDAIASYMNDRLIYRISENEYHELEKLTKHMNAKCEVDELIVNLKRYIPEYSRYKESDLILGDEKIIIATIHKAKGLEFEDVIVPGCTSEDFPSYYSRRDNKEDEDARLLYVAMTRAKKRLLITSHTKKQLRNRTIIVSPSKFLNPIMNMINENGVRASD